MKVLSLFDGISCGRVALERGGVLIDSYDAYEIEPWAIKISEKNFPDIKHHGDVTKEDFTKYEGYDLLIGGSPCQGFSYAGRGLNFEDARSKLFFEFVRAIKEANPRYFLLENVVMKKEWRDIISGYLGVEPIEINSSLVSAQNRRRLYWTNIPDVQQPKDKHIRLADILESAEYTNPGAIRGRKFGDGFVQCLEISREHLDKSNCLTTVNKDNVVTSLPEGCYKNAFGGNLPWRYYTVKEMCRLQTIPDNYLDTVPKTVAQKVLGNGWTVDVIAHILKNLKG